MKLCKGLPKLSMPKGGEQTCEELPSQTAAADSPAGPVQCHLEL